MERAWIISSGTELTLGQTVDTNAAWLARQLAELGIRAERLVVVPDALDALRAVLLEAAEACDLIIITGGLGPTDDDQTRQALAGAAGVPLELDQASLAGLRAFFAQRGRGMPETNRTQAMIPRSGRALPNTSGTAPGIALDLCGTPCYALPGVPFEMQAMFTRQVAPRLQAAAEGRVLLSRQLHCSGRPEAELGEQLHDLMRPGQNPGVGLTAELGVISVCIHATAAGHPSAQALLDQTEREIRTRLGKVVFGQGKDTLASAVGELLVAAGRTVSTAESCTGGLIGELLTDVPGSSRYYLGGVVSYADEVKRNLLGVPPALLERYGAVCEPVAREMAAGARRVFGSDYAVSVTGIAGPAGGSPEKPVGLVYVAVASAGENRAHEFRFGSDTPRSVIRARAARTALNLLRQALLDSAAAG